MIIIAGPCQLESCQHGFESVDFLKELMADYPVDYYFKTSFDKANRTSKDSPRGVGIDFFEGFAQIARHEMGVKLLTDIHDTNQAKRLGHKVDVLQIPAMLSRQTDLIESASIWGDVINIKKGQFMSPYGIKHAAAKTKIKNNRPEIWLTERGTTFGYNNLVVDFRSFIIMKEENPDAKIIFDCTHSTQLSSQGSDRSGGQRCFSLPLARAAMATKSIDGLFLETHHDPDNAPSDGPSMIPWSDMKQFMDEVCNV